MSRCLPCHHQHRLGGSGGRPFQTVSAIDK
nr:MAG TPA: cytochrome c-552 [Caudoviricetes sp.]